MHVISQVTSNGQSLITAGLADGESSPAVGATVEGGTGTVVAIGPIQITATGALSRRVRDGLITLVIDQTGA